MTLQCETCLPQNKALMWQDHTLFSSGPLSGPGRLPNMLWQFRSFQDQKGFRVNRRISEVCRQIAASSKIILKSCLEPGRSFHVSSDGCFCFIHTSWISTTHFQACQTQFCPTYLTQSCKHCPSCVFYQLTVLFWHSLIPLCCIKCKLFIFAFHGTFPTSLPVMTDICLFKNVKLLWP